MSDRWEIMLQTWQGQADKPLLDGHAAVGDAIFMCWLYWDAKHPELKATPADLIEMARLVLEHQRWLMDR